METNIYDILKEEKEYWKKVDTIEHLTLIYYIDMYIKEDMKILEIDAQTGRYTRHFINNGYMVDAVEKREKYIDAINELKDPKKKINIIKDDITDLKDIKNETYDMVLLINPFKNKENEEDFSKIYKEALRVLKKKGLIYSVFLLNDLQIMKNGFTNEYIDCLIKEALENCPKEKYQEEYKKILDDILDFDTPIDCVFSIERKDNIVEFLNQFDIVRLHLVSLDLLTKSFMEKQINDMNDNCLQLYFKYFLSICERNDMIGLSDTILDISQKR